MEVCHDLMMLGLTTRAYAIDYDDDEYDWLAVMACDARVCAKVMEYATVWYLLSRETGDSLYYFIAATCLLCPLQSSNGVLDGRLERTRIGSNYLSNLLSILEDKESRHCAYSKVLRQIRHFVDINLEEFRSVVLFRHPASSVFTIESNWDWKVTEQTYLTS